MEQRNILINFIKEVYEYFKNDYLLIIDFLNAPSPWDRHFLSDKIDENQLTTLKYEMERSIILTYKTNIINEAVATKKISSVDKRIFDELSRGQTLSAIFLNDNDACIIMQKHFFSVMKEIFDYKENTHNKFDNTIWDLTYIHNNLYDKFDLERISSGDQENPFTQELLEKTRDAFEINLYAQVVHYFNRNFRTVEEEKEFLNYLYSLCYAYLLYEQTKGEIESFTANEAAIETVVEENIDTFESFYYNKEVGICVLRLLAAMCEDLGTKYDLRKFIKNSRIQNCFRNFDENYDTKYQPDIMIYDFSIDKKLEEILDYLLEQSNIDDVHEILRGHDSIYGVLFEHGLDPRYEDFFKRLLIQKVMGDALEAELYYRNHETRAVFPHVEVLKGLKDNDSSIYREFNNDGDELLSMYWYYHSDKEYVREKARLEAYESKELPYIMKLNPYAHYNYIHIVNGDVVGLDSVEKLNDIIDLDVNGIQKQITTNPSYISMIVMNVYEHLVQEPSASVKSLIELIEKEDNITDYLIAHPVQLLAIIKMFKDYNKEGLTNSQEMDLRNRIQDEEKRMVLKKLNPFDEGDKKQ